MADIVFLVDGSASIGLSNFQQIRDFLSSLVSNFDIAPNKVRIGLVQFSDTPRTEFYLKTYENKQQILDYIRQLPYKTGGTNTGLGLEFLLKSHFVEEAGSRAKWNVPQISVVITDGNSQDEVEPHAQELRQKGIKLYAIGIKDADEKLLKQIANQPYDQYVYSVSDFTALQEISQNVIHKLCTTVEEAKGLQADCREITSADIVLLVDSSDSVGDTNFAEIRRFLHTFVDRLEIGGDKVRVGLAQFSHAPYQEFLLDAYRDKANLLKQLENIMYHKGGTNIAKALDFIRESYFSQARKNVPRIAIVITNGNTNDTAEEAAQKLRQQGVVIFVIKTGQADATHLSTVANSPQEEFLFSVDTYQKLDGLVENLRRRVCNAVEDQLRALAMKFADIFVLVDSTALRKEAQQMKTFLARIVNQMNIGKDANRVGLAQFSKDVQVEFLFNTNKTKEEILSSIRSLQLKPKEPRRIGNAIEYARKNFFNTSAGSRISQGFKQHLLVMTAGKSDDNVLRPARVIKNEAVKVIVVGFGQTEMDVMEDIASPKQSYKLETPNTLQKVRMTVESKEPPKITGECIAAEIADIVFIVDGSRNVGPENFHIIRTFLQNTIAALDVAMDKVRIAIVQYSDVPRADVYLNTFSDKKEILDYVKTLSYGRGKSNTGAALKFAKEQVFTKVRGSRQDQHVEQIAVVITEAKSADDVSSPAAELRRLGVKIFALGIKDINANEPQEIASYPSKKFLFNMESFTKLNALSNELMRSLCGNIKDAFVTLLKNITLHQGCKFTAEADMYFLLDESGSISYDDFDDMKAFILEFLHVFEIGPDQVRIGVVKFADKATPVFHLNTYNTKAEVQKAVKALFMEGGGTRTDLGLEEMIPLFKQAEQTRKKKVREFLIVITDGKSEHVGKPLKVHAEQLRKQNVTIYAIGVKDADKAELEDMSGSPKRTFFVNNYDALKEIKSKILKEICSFEACSDLLADVVFLIDGADEVDPVDFEQMKELIEFTVEKLPIRQNRVRLAVMQYSTHAKVEFALNAFYDKDKLQKEIMSIKQLGGRSFTGKALEEVAQAFEEADGGRANTLQFLVVVTDSLAKDNVTLPARALRDKNINIYAVGMGHANRDQLFEISGSRERVYLENNFGSMQNLGSEVIFKICNTECKRPELVDIIFLVDVAGSINKESFQSMKSFMETLVSKSEVGAKRVRIGTITYADQPQSEFTLIQYSSKAEVLKSISELRSLGGRRNTAQALKYSLSYFAAGHGGRRAQNIPQVLLLITDGPVADTYDLTDWPVDLKDSEVNMFAIGVAGAREDELRSITLNNQRAFYVDTYQDLEALYKPITQELCNLTKPVCEKEEADLVILIDGSESISSLDWETVKITLINLVKKLEIAPDKWQVGVAQFSDKLLDHFYLNQYNNVAGVEQGIRDITQRRQGTHTWAALKLVQDYFKTEHGSRINKGVSQNLLLVTDGKANDEEDLQSLAQIRAKDIEIFAIGIGSNINQHELLKIAGSKERIFFESFESLPLKTTTTKVLQAICIPSVILSPHGCLVDIGIGFAVSQRTSTQPLLGPHTETLVAAAVQRLSTMGQLCCLSVDAAETRIGFRLVSGREGKIIDDFAFEEYDENVVRKVLALRPAIPMAFNALLLNSFKQKFASSQAGVKVVILFTDGLHDTLEHLKKSSDSLRESGISALLIVALDGNVDYQQLEFGRGFSYNKPLSISMLNVGNALQDQIKAVASAECCNVSCACSGDVGFSGFPGLPGLKGVPGLRGHPGFPGEVGAMGRRGLLGLNGTQGHQGCSGKRGIKGSTGYSGNRGEQGEIGLDGVDGEQLLPLSPFGCQGLKGVRGTPGVKGNRGVKGEPGSPGLDNRVSGPKGERGYIGLPVRARLGGQGPGGAPGRPGDSGEPGFPGRKGPPGSKGFSSTVKGEPGSEGFAGYPGYQGPVGGEGLKGQKGYRGNPGVQSTAFPQGLYGPAGSEGLKGSQGPRGQRGLPGDTGSKGNIGPEGFRGSPGHPGTDGFGPPGRKGQQDVHSHREIQVSMVILGCRVRMVLRGTVVSWAPKDAQEGRQCPAYPTELVIALDVSADVTPQVFMRMRSAALSLLGDITIADTSCPVGARVSVVSYSNETNYLLRFSDHRQKKTLLEAVRGISLQRTRNTRNVGRAMRFVAQNVFKRVRDGKLVRKVAVFLTNGPSEEASGIATAMLEFKALDINLGVIAFRAAPDIRHAIQADETRSFMMFDSQRANRIKQCVICFDRCHPDQTCGIIQSPVPEEVDVDLTVLMDASSDLQMDQYSGAKQLLLSLLDELAVSSDPDRKDGRPRVGVYQQSSAYPVTHIKEEFGLGTFKDRALMKRHISQGMQQAGGSSSLVHALDWMVTNAVLKASAPRRKRMVLVILGEDVGHLGREDMDYVSKLCMCNNVVVFTVTVGEKFSSAQAEELSTFPVEQHMVHLGQLAQRDLKYAQRFIRGFLRMLSRDFFSKPSSQSGECGTFVSRQADQVPYPEEGVDQSTTPPTMVSEEVPMEPQPEAYTGLPSRVLWGVRDVQKNVYQTVSHLHNHTVAYSETTGYTEATVEEEEEEEDDDVAKPQSGPDESKARCLLNKDVGTVCANYESRWFYDRNMQRCTHFWYGGCGGNSNRFLTEMECLKTCGTLEPEKLLKDEPSPEDLCQLPQDTGKCVDFLLKWHFNTQNQKCTTFWYGGCEGNGNSKLVNHPSAQPAVTLTSSPRALEQGVASPLRCLPQRPGPRSVPLGSDASQAPLREADSIRVDHHGDLARPTKVDVLQH
ncbi:hypothetical protein P4O66_013255, partial [Electrophorus voltai]